MLRDPDHALGDRIEIQVDAADTNNRIHPWPPTGGAHGFGFGPSSVCGFGFSAGLAFGAGIFGAGWFGQGAARFDINTTAAYVAGDYSVAARSIDPAGNAGSYTAPVTIAHRPTPPSPAGLAVSGAGVMSWSWSDP